MHRHQPITTATPRCCCLASRDRSLAEQSVDCTVRRSRMTATLPVVSNQIQCRWRLLRLHARSFIEAAGAGAGRQVGSVAPSLCRPPRPTSSHPAEEGLSSITTSNLQMRADPCRLHHHHYRTPTQAPSHSQSPLPIDCHTTSPHIPTYHQLYLYLTSSTPPSSRPRDCFSVSFVHRACDAQKV